MSDDGTVVSMVARKRSGGGRHGPLNILNASDLEGREVPKRDWIIPSVLLRRSLTLFGGDGGVGKTLLCQQLQVAAALAVDWLGIPIPEPITSFGLYCEDDEDELHRRFHAICKHYGASFSELDGRVLYISRVDEDNELVNFTGKTENPKAVNSPLMEQIDEIYELHGVRLGIFDTVSDIFGGNENNRSQVKRFANRIRRLTRGNNGGIIINAHPSKASMNDGSFYSGSTAWHGAVRSRLYLGRPKKTADSEEEDLAANERLLRVMKSNYSPAGGKIKCRWEEGAFVLEGHGTNASMMDRLEAKQKLLAAARYLVERGTFVAAATNTRQSLTALARQLPSCRDLDFSILAWAQDRLEQEGTLRIVELGPKSKRRKYIRPTDLLYPGETAEMVP